MSWGAVACIALVALAGCAPKPVSPVAATPTAGGDARCDVSAATALVGRSADASLAEAQRLSGARTVRRYATGDALTMDYRADRLNVETDAGGTIVKLSCG